ncbi:transmembrane protein 254 [Rhinatrema bivittatum]|uniref:transmembrane protein 254 n=1 Tax=Rhinatrema bivittatum TaxID=194408 RepID=UPI001127A513|nr:transmembrane protein 254 [Rhinatrema bivittatum]XP_029465346.1 transmembrane protein 254 [Rhinatrema bivittatum]
MHENADNTYFRRPSLFWMTVITLSMGFFMWTVFWPTQIPFQHLGPAGSLIKYLVDYHYKWLYWGFWTACGIHVAEALYSFRLCNAKGITDNQAQVQWVLQTMLFGMASLFLLQSYKPEKLKKRH